MTDHTLTHAVIYCRVSGAKQVREGDGLASQETRCREYAKYKGYEVKRVFADDITGKLIQRPTMTEMLAFLRNHKSKGEHVVIIDDISRFARNLRAHLELRSTLSEAGGILESPSIEFGEDSDSILVENLLASVAQHQREKNGEQTKNRMRARCMNGYWVFHAPVGYKYEKVKRHGKLLVRDEPIATIVAEALEGYASGRFETFVEIKRFLDNQPDYPKGKYGEVYSSRIPELLSKPLYAGYITHERWDIHLHPAHHEGLISLETWHKIQQRMTADGERRTLETAPAQPVAPIRKDTRPEFPLRGFVTCASCDKPMTAAWSKGRSARYGYYFCQTKGCESRRKNIRKDDIEEEFETLLHGILPTREAYEVIAAMLKELWEDRRNNATAIAEKAKKEIEKLEGKASQVMERLLATSQPTLIKAYEGEIQKIEESKLILAEKTQQTTENLRPFEETYRTALDFS